ncbi:MAG: S41 family peptidase [Clostridia bacterium]|nr:S41 family peptidase [Clostridia bacterium]
MKKRFLIFALIAALLVGALAAFSAVGETRRGTVTIDRAEYDRLLKYEKLDEVMQYISAYYYQEPDTDKMLDYAVQGMLAGLEDPYTFYYDAESWKSLWEDEEGEYTGIGVQLLANYEDQTVKITRVFRDTPAQQVGLRKNDILVRAEDLEVTAETMEAAVKIMRGEVGGQVQVEVLRGEEYITFDITRAAIHTNNVDYAMLDDNVGYVILYQFSTDSLISDFTAAMDALEAQGAKSIILDLRDNPGGWVDDAVKVADRFLDSKLVVYSKTRFSSDTNPQYTKSGADNIPLVLLVNENSASSSEILTGALQDHNRATVVGTQTFGKGIMQYVLGLSDNETGIQLTYCEYFTPNGNHVHGIGLTPDIEVEMPEDMNYATLDVGDMSDPQLKAAWDEAVKLQ